RREVRYAPPGFERSSRSFLAPRCARGWILGESSLSTAQRRSSPLAYPKTQMATAGLFASTGAAAPDPLVRAATSEGIGRALFDSGGRPANPSEEFARPRVRREHTLWM